MIRVYSSTQCKYCDKLKKLLNNEKIEFINIDVDDEKNKNECEKLFKFVGEPIIPIIIINKKVLVPNKSFKTIEEALELIHPLL